MNRLEAFRILEIDVTDDKKAIKKAYAALVKQYHPEEYPEKWQEIHAAYETALKGTEIIQVSVSPSPVMNQEAVYRDTAADRKAHQQGEEETAKYGNERKDQEQKGQERKEQERKEQERKERDREEYRKEEREWQERKERDREEEEQGKRVWEREEYRKEQEERDEEDQEQAEKIGEEQEINKIFENIDELIQEKKVQEQKEKEREEEEKRREEEEKKAYRKAYEERQLRKWEDWGESLKKVLKYIAVFAALFLIVRGKIDENREEERTKMETLKELEGNLVKENESFVQEREDWMQRQFYLPSLAYSYEEKQKEVLDSGICLQEGIYLTTFDEQLAEETGAYTIREADVPKQAVPFLDSDDGEYRVWSFCITSNKEPECMSLWCDLEKLGFGKGARIFNYDKEQDEYVEVELDGETEISLGQYSYNILDYRVFMIDTHVHEEGETCEHPVVLISY